MIGKEKWTALEERMEKLGVKESDFVEKFVLGSGPGGQKINKTASCVYLKHTPSNTEVKCQQSRSREENRYHARAQIIEKLEKEIAGIQTKKEKEIEKIRRQKRKRTKRQQEKMLKEKKEHSSIKHLRKSPQSED